MIKVLHSSCLRGAKDAQIVSVLCVNFSSQAGVGKKPFNLCPGVTFNAHQWEGFHLSHLMQQQELTLCLASNVYGYFVRNLKIDIQQVELSRATLEFYCNSPNHISGQNILVWVQNFVWTQNCVDAKKKWTNNFIRIKFLGSSFFRPKFSPTQYFFTQTKIF